MSSIDEIKNKLNIDNIDKKNREDLFNKFVEKGGKVVEDKKKSNIVNFDRNKQILINKQLQKDNQKNRNKNYANKPSSMVNQKINEQKQLEKKTTSSVNTRKKHPLIIYFLGLYQSVFSLSGDFNRKFALNMNQDLPVILNELDQVCFQIINLEQSKKWQAIDLINVANVFGYEIIERLHSLNNKELLLKISNYFDGQRNILCSKIINELGFLFKNFVILYPYWESTKQVLFESQQIYHDIMKVNPLFSRSKINKNIDRIFIYYLPRILTILNYNLGFKIPFDFNRMHEFAKITPDKDMGSITNELKEQRQNYLKNIQKEKEEQLNKIKEEFKQKEELQVPKFIQKGLETINEVVSRISDSYTRDNTAMMFEENEKMLEFYFLFKEFDENYSFILTTSQIKLSPKMQDGVKIDIKSNLEKHYLLFNEILTSIKDYVKLMENFKKIKEDFANSPFVMQQKINDLEKKRIHDFFEIKGKASTFFKRLSAELQTLILDYKGEKRLLQNGDDKFYFEIGNDNKKNKFNNFTIINALINILSFSSAFYFYLNNGKLGRGSGIYFPDQPKS
jgi:hypothetical protein